MTDGETSRFRVGVVTIWEVDAVDERNAQRIAEGAVQFMVTDVSGRERGVQPVVRWTHSNGLEYEATLLRGPAEVGVALRNQYLHVGVHQPTRETSVGCPCSCNNGGFCGGCGHAGCGGRR